MNLLQELQTRTEVAQKSTKEEVQSVFEAIVDQCLSMADIGKDSIYIDSSDIEADGAAVCRESSFDDAFTRAMAQIVDSGVTVKTTREVHLFLLEWAS
jgi:ribonuclease PH